MIININGLFFALSYALDCVEGELVGVSTGHSGRVAYLSTVLGKEMGITEEELADLSICAVMHDNALTEYLADEYQTGELQNGIRPVNEMPEEKMEKLLSSHCTMGERNMKKFPFLCNSKGFVLYHHETADGTGPFGKTTDEIPLGSQLIHLADALDSTLNLGSRPKEKYQEALRYLNQNKGTLFAPEIVEAFEKSFDTLGFGGMEKEKINSSLAGLVPDRSENYSRQQVGCIVDVFAKIIDYKSEFTRNHSLGIAGKAEQMGKRYGYDDETCTKLYAAGALHDIGKLAIHNNVLEKPDKLSAEEFSYMQNHAWYTYQILSGIEGFEDVARWASRHHEKLNGKGYPFGLTAEALDEKDRLLACLDIYQALTEPRPYKEGMAHEKTMSIMYDMVEKGMLDKKITQDIDKVFGKR